MIHRLAHRLRDMQILPYIVVTSPHISHVYELYYKAFETLRKVKQIKTTDENDRFCAIVGGTLKEHLTVIPSLAMGVLECRHLVDSETMDHLMNTLLRSVRFQSSLVIANQCSESLVESSQNSISP